MKDMKVTVLWGATVLCVLATSRALHTDMTDFTTAIKDYCFTKFPKPCDLQNYTDWYKVGSYCMKYFNTPMNFSDAEFSCRNTVPGGHLVSVHNNQTNTDLVCIIMKYNYAEPRIWLGGLELFKTYAFVWTDGSSWNYDNWVPGQPDNTAAVEDCVEMNWKNTGHWNDGRCELKKNFVCAFKTRV